MFTVPELAAEALCSFLAADMSRRFGLIQAGLIERTSTAVVRVLLISEVNHPDYCTTQRRVFAMC